jgi:hypothetical protein
MHGHHDADDRVKVAEPLTIFRMRPAPVGLDQSFTKFAEAAREMGQCMIVFMGLLLEDPLRMFE